MTGVTVAGTSQTSTLELREDSPACPAWLGPWEKMPRGTVLITVTYGKGLGLRIPSFQPRGCCLLVSLL